MSTTAPVKTSRFPVIEVAGSHREMGRQIGEATRDSIRELVEVVTDRINVGRATHKQITNEQALEVARTSIAYAAEYAPELMDEVEGVAEGADLTVDQMMLVNVRNQVPAAVDGACTGVVVEPKCSVSEDRFRRAELGQRPRDGPVFDRPGPAANRRAGAHELHATRHHRIHGPQRCGTGRGNEHVARAGEGSGRALVFPCGDACTCTHRWKPSSTKYGGLSGQFLRTSPC